MNGVPDTKMVSHRDIRYGRRTWSDSIGVPRLFVLGLFTDRLSQCCFPNVNMDAPKVLRN